MKPGDLVRSTWMMDGFGLAATGIIVDMRTAEGHVTKTPIVLWTSALGVYENTHTPSIARPEYLEVV